MIGRCRVVSAPVSLFGPKGKTFAKKAAAAKGSTPQTQLTTASPRFQARAAVLENSREHRGPPRVLTEGPRQPSSGVLSAGRLLRLEIALLQSLCANLSRRNRSSLTWPIGAGTPSSGSAPTID